MEQAVDGVPENKAGTEKGFKLFEREQLERTSDSDGLTLTQNR
jgi:hypothetical protein